MNNEYVEAYSYSSFGGGEEFGIKVLIAAGRDLTTNERHLVRECAEKIQKEFLKNNIFSNPEKMKAAREEKAKILALFPNPVYVKEIPNGYCSDYCCSHRPWFLVTTPVGEIKIGWRKRVIEIVWENSDVVSNAYELFPNEDTTRSGKLIHAWGYDKAKEYIHKLLEKED
jgi:hypothetical protein